MGKIRRYPPVKLIIGLIYKDSSVYNKTKDKLRKKFGQIDFESAPLEFNFTDYYEKEFGKSLTRRFLSFKKAVPAHELFRIKLYTNRLEHKFMSAKNRLINIDPGYLDLAKLVLASTKDHCHRIYLYKGIFAEITLTFKDNSFQPWEWTYADYRTPEYIKIFNEIRKLC